MPIVGFFYDKIIADRKKDLLKGDVKVKNNLVLQALNQIDIDIGNKKQDVIKLSFEFFTEYQPNIGSINLSGHLLFSDSPENTKSILNMWKKDKKIPEQYAVQFINAILIRSNIKALELSQSINLPPHIKLPVVLPKQDIKNYIG